MKCYETIRKCAPLFMFVLTFSISEFAAAGEDELQSHFRCMELSSQRFRPYYMEAIDGGTAYKDWSQTRKGLLGQNPMTSLDECEDAIEVANAQFGVICSRTGLNGWKPTIYTGTTPGRADFGYLGGSSITKFEDCLLATEHSSDKGVCFWGGSSWYVSPISREGLIAGPYSSVEACIAYTSVGND